VKRHLATAVLVLVALCAGYAARPTRPIEQPARTDTVPPARLLEQVEALKLDNLGLTQRLQGWEVRPPRVVVRADTVVLPPDTVFLPLLRASARGLLTIPVLVSDSVPYYRPEVWRGFDVSDCDNGWVIQGGDLLCNRPRLGHLSFGFDSNLTYQSDGVQLVGAAGLYWRPTYRSGWNAYLTVSTDTRGSFGLRKAWEFF